MSAPEATGSPRGFWGWRATYEDDGDIFEIGFSLPEDIGSGAIRGGIQLRACRSPGSLMTEWSAMRARFDRVWLHNPDCELPPPEMFRRRFL